MPAHRHPKPARSIKALPARRLPLGTPALDRKNFESRTSQHINPSDRSTATTSTTSQHTSNGNDSLAIMSDTGSEYQERAKVKLRRQQERIQQADPLNKPPPPPMEKPRAQSRKQAWKPFDYESMPPPPIPGVDEVRVNRYPAQSRDPSLSRTLSSLSQQTTATGGVEMERNDSSVFENTGFQMYSTRRRTRQVLTDQSSFTDPSPQEKPKTVEAEYDKNEILEVFKKHLPGLDYLAANTGMADGEVHFVQHPNGDVAAQIWSATDFQWCSLGMWSNIRKKVEGQLAGDRLKGETAWQKLQQNTLAYFRVLAKQREAIAMKKPFGQEDIKHALPEPPQVAAVSPRTTVAHHDTAVQPTVSQYAYANGSQGVTTGPRTDQYPFTHLNPFTRNEDPFSANQASTPATMPFFRSNGMVPSNQMHNHAAPWSTRHDGVSSNKPPTHSGIRPSAKPFEPMGNFKMIPTASSRDPATPTSHSKREATLLPETRQAMLDQLHQLGDRASKRSMSQNNLANCSRTVMNDPYQQTEASEHGDEHTSPPLSRKPSTASGTFPVALSNTTDITAPKASRHGHFSADFEKMCAGWQDSQPLAQELEPKTSILTDGSVPDTGREKVTVATYTAEPNRAGKQAKKSYDQDLDEWWTSGKKFARHEEFHQRIMASESSKRKPTSHQSSEIPEAENVDITRILIPVYENLAAYKEAAVSGRRDYWCRWTQPPEWCIDRSPRGNDSFFDSTWGQPPARVGRDPRYRNIPGDMRFGGFSPAYAQQGPAAVGSPSAVKGTTGSFGGVGVTGAGGPLARLGYGGSRF